MARDGPLLYKCFIYIYKPLCGEMCVRVLNFNNKSADSESKNSVSQSSVALQNFKGVLIAILLKE